MVIHHFTWEPSTSFDQFNSTQVEQLDQLCRGLINSSVSSLSKIDLASTLAPAVVVNKNGPLITWGIGLIFVTIINMCAVVGIGVMRFLSKNVYNQVITLFVGLGVGSLSGSSFYHLLPQAHPSLVVNHDYLDMAHISLVGVYAFFFCDKIIKIILEIRKKNQHIHHRRMSIENGMTSDRSDATLVTEAGEKEEDLLRSVLKKGQISRADVDETEMMTLADKSRNAMGDQAHGICVHDHSIEFRAGDSAIAAVAWMIIFGDGLHNFIDGISIGAAFADSIHSGLSISLAVLCEEFPHELGDVAILVASGMSLKQALVYNLLSAITCYVGFIIGVVIGDLGPDTSKYAFGLAGGMFLYISLACMMPEMKKAMEEALNVSLRHGLYVLFLQTVGLFSGLTLMYVMARYGEEISI